MISSSATNSGALSVGEPDHGASQSPPPGGFSSRAMAAVPPPGLILLAILSIQVGAALAINLFPVLGPTTTVFCRIALAALILLAITRPRIDRSVIQNGPILLTYGVALGIMNWCFYESIARIPLGIAVTIEFLGPLGVAVATSRRLIDLLWVAIAILGLGLLTPDIGHDLDPVGMAYAAAAGFCWAAFILLSKRVGQRLPGNSGLAFGMVVAALLLAPFSIDGVAPVLTDHWLLLSVLGVALLSTAIPFYLEFEALKRLPARTYGILVTLEPAIATLVGIALLGEMLDLPISIAIACVTIAAIGATMFRER